MKPDFDAAARAIAAVVFDWHELHLSPGIEERISQTLRAAYAAGLEAAAEIAYDWRDDVGFSSLVAIEVAKKILAEKEKQP